MHRYITYKTKIGMSNALLSTMYNMSVAATQRSISTARNALMKHFTPNYIGFNHITRDEIIHHHTRQLAKTLFGGHEDPAILVLDGTYFYIQKSSQFHFQRKCYNLHKNHDGSFYYWSYNQFLRSIFQ